MWMTYIGEENCFPVIISSNSSRIGAEGLGWFMWITIVVDEMFVSVFPLSTEYIGT